MIQQYHVLPCKFKYNDDQHVLICVFWCIFESKTLSNSFNCLHFDLIKKVNIFKIYNIFFFEIIGSQLVEIIGH